MAVQPALEKFDNKVSSCLMCVKSNCVDFGTFPRTPKTKLHSETIHLLLKIEETLLHVNSLYSRSLWICEEKELVHEIAGLGELRSPWHECQMAWLQGCNSIDIWDLD